jgi:hypothetical protein
METTPCLSCSAGDVLLGTGFCRDLQQEFCTDVGHHAASPRRHELAAISSFDQKKIGRHETFLNELHRSRHGIRVD